jgi:galactokinase
VNLIGEHTDYNDGFVLPMAIDRAVWIAAQPRGDGRVVVRALDLDDVLDFALSDLKRGCGSWAEYVKGVAWTLQEAGYELQGWEGVLAGDVPRGAGLSSSAALELATARVFAAVSGLRWEPVEMAKLCQRAESDWVGMRCGIMDQMISAVGQANHALLIDCRSLEAEPVPLPPKTAVVVLDTATRRELAGSAYNERRTQCSTAARRLGVPALRDVTAEQLEAASDHIETSSFRRARHVITENARTRQAAEAMRAGDAVEVGRLMNASHASLRDDFEASSGALNAMVECARHMDSCYGARMTGAGFGGCAVALVRAPDAESFAISVADCYERATSIRPDVYVCRAACGATLLSDS